MPRSTPPAGGAASAGVSKPARKTRRLRQAPRGATSNWYLHQLARLGNDDLDDDEKERIALQVKGLHRVKPVPKSRAAQGATVFNSVTGHHEWLPTDRAFKIVFGSSRVWQALYTSLRSPTWLLVVNPERYCEDRQRYIGGLQQLAGHVKAKQAVQLAASALGLVGHSGGLCNAKGTQLTTWQSAWHDELRDLWDRHADANAYDPYWLELCQFIRGTFLFVDGPVLPTAGANLDGVTTEELMRHIRWDLNLSGRGNPTVLGDAPTLWDIANYLHAEWSTWLRTLEASFLAFRDHG